MNVIRVILLLARDDTNLGASRNRETTTSILGTEAMGNFDIQFDSK